MIYFAIKTGAALRVSWVETKQSRFPEQGSSHAHYTKSGAGGNGGICSCIYSSHLGEVHIFAVCRDTDHWATHGFQYSANHGACGSRPSFQLSSSVLSLPLVELAVGSRIDCTDSPQFYSQGHGASGWRR